MRELNIGEEVRIKCVESKFIRKDGIWECDLCVFGTKQLNVCVNSDMFKLCSNQFRSDKKNVHFEIVE